MHFFLTPASMYGDDINRMLEERYAIDRLSGGINEMAEVFDLDFLLLDTHPGVNEENSNWPWRWLTAWCWSCAPIVRTFRVRR